MRRLLLLRHAKSSWADPSVDDMSRPLAPRGEEAAALIGRHLNSQKLIPDLILCSPAVRARQTLDLLAAQLEQPASNHRRLELRPRLYLASPAEHLDVVHSVAMDAPKLMIIGHNNGIGAFASALCAQGDPRALACMRAKFPTAALALIRFDIQSWQDARLGEGSLEDFVRPRDLA